MAQFKCFQWRCILVCCNDHKYCILFRQTSNGNSDPNSTKSRGSRVHMFHHRKVLSLDAETNTWIIWTKRINTTIIVFFFFKFLLKKPQFMVWMKRHFPKFLSKGWKLYNPWLNFRMLWFMIRLNIIPSSCMLLSQQLLLCGLSRHLGLDFCTQQQLSIVVCSVAHPCSKSLFLHLMILFL